MKTQRNREPYILILRFEADCSVVGGVVALRGYGLLGVFLVFREGDYPVSRFRENLGSTLGPSPQ